MLKNYFVVALRNLRREKGYALINILGLAVGISAFMIILLFVQHEFMYDRFYPEANRMYRVLQWRANSTQKTAITPAPLAIRLQEEYPQIAYATTIDDLNDEKGLLSFEGRHLWQTGFWGDAHFFDVFQFKILEGNRAHLLNEPGAIVLTRSLATKLLGEGPAVGKVVKFQNQDEYSVTGVMQDVPELSSFRFDFVLSVSSQPYYRENVQNNTLNGNLSWQTFVKLREGADPAQLENEFPRFVDKHIAGEGDNPEHRLFFGLQPILRMHLFSDFRYEKAFTGSIQQVLLLVSIAFIILAMACINYMNLAIARSIQRMKEVGLRKTIGASKRQLIGQFVGESIVTTAIALSLALVIVYFLLPLFGYLLQRPLTFSYFSDWLQFPLLVFILLIVGCAAGSYPAFYVSRIQPAAILKGQVGRKNPIRGLQRGLIISQFTASVGLVACGLIIYQQLQYLQEKDLGYTKEDVHVFPLYDDSLSGNIAAIRNAFEEDPNVITVSYSDYLPANINSSTEIKDWNASDPDELLSIYQVRVSTEFLSTFGIPVLAGQGFQVYEQTGDATPVLVNNSAATAMGLTPEEAIGMEFGHFDHRRRIVGVVKDFHMHSMHIPIAPLMVMYDGNAARARYLAVKMRPNDVQSSLLNLKQVLQTFTPFPVENQSLAETLDIAYAEERRLGHTFSYFTLLALLISGLGLFGLSALAAEQRKKEIGIRKVLGASIRKIVFLLTSEFTRLVIVALILASPIAYLLMQRWLESFAYQTKIGLEVFFVTSLVALGLALVTVSFQAIKAALSNPVDSLQQN